jgi:CubicO group peptidase (beta-lactamase class C family)
MKKNSWIYALLILLSLVTLNSACAQDLHQRNENVIQEQTKVADAVVLLNNKNGLIPLKNLDKLSIASVNFGFSQSQAFDSLLLKYASIKSFQAADYLTEDQYFNNLADDLKFYNQIIVQLASADLHNPQIIDFIREINRHKSVVIAMFGDGKSLAKLNFPNLPLIWCESASQISAMYVAQVIFGGVAARQTLKADYSTLYKAGSGFKTEKIRLQYTVPEEAGINAEELLPIDGIMQEALNQKATPGAVVLIAKNGKVIFNKAYGYHTYDKTRKVKLTDIYDLASLTKTSATTLEVMRLTEQGKLNLDSPAKNFIALTRNTDKANITSRNLMLHQAGLIPFIPFYRSITASDFSRDSSASFPVKVADNYYMRKNYFKDTMWPQMLKSPLKDVGTYVYSDLSMYFMKEIVETVTSEPLDKYVEREFYKPLGMQTAGFLPRNRFPKEQIVPTENDKTFRLTLLEGYVHDQGAAMVGGVSGHAGLFSSANDLAILYQMLLNKGSYGGTQYFKPETVEMYTAQQSAKSRRGLGFDRRDPDASKSYPSELASDQTYGHTGYTGIFVWVDPKYNLVYIFLSNRVHPAVSNKISDLRTRGRIQDVVYKAFIQAEMNK